MRVTNRSMLDNALQQIQLNQERLQVAQHQSETGIAVAMPSDNPVGWNQIQSDTEQLSRLDAYNQNIQLVQSRLGATEAALQSTNGLLQRFRELLMMGLNQVAGTVTVGQEAGQVYGQLVQLTNSSYNGDYLFGGFTTTPPFTGTTFVGDNNKRAVEVSPFGATVFGVSAQEAFGVTPGQDVYTDIAAAVQGLQSGNRAQITAGLDAVDSHIKMIADSLSSVGAQDDTLQNAQTGNTSYSTLLQQSAGQVKNINAAQVYSQLAADQYAQQATYAVLGAIGKMSLINYI